MTAQLINTFLCFCCPIYGWTHTKHHQKRSLWMMQNMIWEIYCCSYLFNMKFRLTFFFIHFILFSTWKNIFFWLSVCSFSITLLNDDVIKMHVQNVPWFICLKRSTFHFHSFNTFCNIWIYCKTSCQIAQTKIVNFLQNA